MNVVFCGYRKWSHEIVKELVENTSDDWTIKAILTINFSDTSFADLDLPVVSVDPAYINKENIKVLSSFSPDVFLFYGWSWIIPKEVYSKYLCFILHPSPLPKYRGGSPLQHQIMAGETTSAVTIFQAEEKIDAGDIYSQTPFSLEGTLDDIFTRIIENGTKDTIKVLDAVVKNAIKPTPQDETLATVFKRRNPSESELTIKDLQSKTSVELYNFIRALGDPYPNAFITCKDGKKLYFTKARIEKSV